MNDSNGRHAGRGRGVLGKDRIEAQSEVGVRFKSEPGSQRRLADHLGDLRRRRRRNIEPPMPSARLTSSGSSRIRCQKSARMVAMTHTQPARASAFSNWMKMRRSSGTDRCEREQFLELIDDEDQLRLLMGQDCRSGMRDRR